jgi:isopentenyl diphosphate isomerase/L-lactate dehydrogenase-like FMN-dependent dehydrogenase
MTTDFNAYNVSDLRELARKRLPRGLFEYVDRGTEDEVSLRNNRAVFDRLRFRPRTMTNVSKRDLRTEIFGTQYKLPVGIAPTGSAGLMWYEGEIALARAAREAGVPFTLSTSSLTAMERVAAEAGGDIWFQLYFWPDRSMSTQLVERAKACGFKVLMVTVDGVSAGNREYNMRNGFTAPFSVSRRNFFDIAAHPRWLLSVMAHYMLTTGMPMFENYPAEARAKMTSGPMGRASLRSDTVSWDDLDAMRKIWPHKLVVKGMLDPRDAKKAIERGADGVLVSNHGGRNLDGAIAPLEALPEIVDAVGNRGTVLVDGGFSRGTDVVKALCLGASAVLLGRATLYGLAIGGQPGATRALDIFRDEISRTMALLGCTSVDKCSPDFLHFTDELLRAPQFRKAAADVVSVVGSAPAA